MVEPQNAMKCSQSFGKPSLLWWMDVNCSSALMASLKPIVTQTALVKVSRSLNKMSRLESESSLWREGWARDGSGHRVLGMCVKLSMNKF